MSDTRFDYSKLRGKIIEKYGKYSKFCEAVGMQYPALNKKLQNNAGFNQHDILDIAKSLDIELAEIGLYFFTLKVLK